MADGAPTRTLSVTLPRTMADDLEEAAQDSGMELDRYLGELIADVFGEGPSRRQDGAARAFQESAASAALEAYDRTGEWVGPDDAFAAVDSALGERERR